MNAPDLFRSGHQPVTTAFLNARVYTMDPRNPWADAVVISGDRIVYAGTGEGAQKFISRETRIHDLKGRLMLPGFIESHLHAAFGSLFREVVKMGSVEGPQQLLDQIREASANSGNKRILALMGFKPQHFGPRGPQASDLDAIDATRPVIVLDYGMHSMWVNSIALQKAGITRETPDPLPGGHYYVRDENGCPTGWCIEPMAFMPVVNKLGITIDDFLEAEKELFPVLSSYGYTSIFDAGSFMEREVFQSYIELENTGLLPFRVHGCHMVGNSRMFNTAIHVLKKLHRRFHSHLFSVNTLKIVYDGTLEALSCAMYDDFPGSPGNRGFELFPPDMLSDLVLQTDEAGFNIHIHAIGNRAISDALSAFAKVKALRGCSPARKTICHNQFFMPDTVNRYRELGMVTAQTTPAWMVHDQATRSMVGTEVYERQMLFASLDKANVRVTFGSDFPVDGGHESLDPFMQMQTGHLRRAVGAPDCEILPPESERLSLETLLRGYTINAAWQLGVDDRLGSVEAGKLADLIVLKHDIFKQAPGEIHRNKVLMTIMDGRIVHNILKDPI